MTVKYTAPKSLQVEDCITGFMTNPTGKQEDKIQHQSHDRPPEIKVEGFCLHGTPSYHLMIAQALSHKPTSYTPHSVSSHQ
jgi:hypothetical protein